MRASESPPSGVRSPPMRTMSLSSSVRFHQPPSPVVKTTSRKLLEPRSMTARVGLTPR